MPAATAQINVRLDAELKRNGDAALSASGMTPSQAVRSLWELASSMADRPGALCDILQPGQAKEEQRERRRAAKRKLALIDQGSTLFAAACSGAGIDTAGAMSLDDEDLKRAAYAECYGDEMSWLYE